MKTCSLKLKLIHNKLNKYILEKQNTFVLNNKKESIQVELKNDNKTY